MAFQLSPGVNVSEIDLTTVVPSVSTTAGAIVGDFTWGPVNKRILVDSEVTLVNRFGKPNSGNFVSFFSAANFLAYGNNLRVVRVVDTDSLLHANNATSVGAGVLIQNEDDYELNFSANTSTAYGAFYARYAGDLGNNIRVSAFANNSTLAFSNWTVTTSTGTVVNLSKYFSAAPNTSTYAASVGGSYDELHIAVIDGTGAITGTAGTVLETFANVSKASDAKNDDGSPNYYVTKIFNESKWIYVASHFAPGWGVSAVRTNFGSTTPLYNQPLSGGLSVNGTLSSYTKGWDLFASSEQVDVSLLIGGYASEVGVAVQNYIAQIATNRKDCMAFISPTQALSVNNTMNVADEIVDYRNNTLSVNTSYAVIDSGWKYQFDKYNNLYRYVPLNADVAGLCVYTDTIRDPWWSPAGLNRGQIKNVVKLSWNPTKTDRDVLYSGGVNPVVAFPGEGVVVFGQKTLQRKSTALDRVNVRRLLISLKGFIGQVANNLVFEQNTNVTRNRFLAQVNPYMESVVQRQGLYTYRVVMDDTNNTADVIDRNQLVGQIYIQPTKTAEFIVLNFNVLPTGATFPA